MIKPIVFLLTARLFSTKSEFGKAKYIHSQKNYPFATYQE